MKRALIVDDSRLARHVLGQLLTEHGVFADTAESAEDALEYLKGHRPDVIFLDHLMPGMDGFQALEAIKANPVTATIPVMMYTSKEGELYLGQARALGALGVLPKSVEPVEVVKVLRSLRLIPSNDPQAQPPASQQSLDARQMRELLAELFYEQSSTLRDELRRELQTLVAKAQAAAAPSPPPLPAAAPAKPERVRFLPAASVVLLIAGAVFAYLYFSTAALLDEAHRRTRSLADTATELSAAAIRPASAATPGGAPPVYELLEWGVNQGGQFPFGHAPLDDARASVLTSLVDELARSEFKGTVAIDVHVGRFCMNYGAEGALVLADPAQPAETCEQIGWPETEAAALGAQESLAFAYAVADAARRHPEIRVETRSRGAGTPLASYPSSSFQVTAGEWNAVAARNQRVEIALHERPRR